MLNLLPDDDTLYAALVARDAAFEGRVFVGVTSTGIFCRLTCPARKPKRSNCRFFDTQAAALEAGFRPCKRCTPLTPEGAPLIAPLIAALEADPLRRWSEADLRRMGHDPSTIRRAFKRHFGISFLEMARLRRLGAGFTTLAQGAQVIDAQLDAGFDSPSAFRSAFARLIGVAPGTLPKDAPLKADWIESPLGPLVAVSCTHRLHLLEFADRKALPTELARLRKTTGHAIALGPQRPTDQIRAELDAYFAGQCARFDTPLQLHGSPFTREVWNALRDIPAGATRSYGDLAKALGRPGASRAVARANGANQIAIAIPCHRVIGADGTLTGYGGGLWRKQRLIEIERSFT
ncbi:MAG: bifunctional transcriptional activator/DNA repair enzyme protein Ada [Rhodobacterales bacterium]|nr:MAG: bifunctional transcriptional activator/DNA repair enzyme protein Ada [Rhodobacterales bacterium]